MYEGTIQFITQDKRGNDKPVKEQFILEHCESFSDAEAQLFDYGSSLTEIDVVAVKRSKLKEIANERTNEAEKIFLATLVDIFLNDDGTEKEIKYTIAFYSKDMNAAHAYISQYASQGYNMSVTKIVESKFVDVLK
jgi:hypothetical protein